MVTDIGVRSTARRGGDRRPRVPYYYPVVRFVTPLEEIVQFQGSDGSTEPEKYRAGQSLRVLYDPVNPHDARLDTANGRWGGVIVFASLGVGFIVIPALIGTVALSCPTRS